MSEATYLTVAEIGDRLRVSKMTAYRPVKEGAIPGIRVGRSVRVQTADLDAFIEASRIGGVR